MAAIALQGVGKTYPGKEAQYILQGIDFTIADGEFVVLVGPSGCGKSTLLRMIAGLEDISAGEIRIGGEVVNDVPPARRGLSMVFQSYALYAHMTVFENIAFGLRLAKVPKAEIKVAVQGVAKMLQMEHLLERRPPQLSGGQRQRVAIGRAIVRKPEVFLFDEPLSNLDTALRVRMRYEFAKLHEDLKTTMVYVTHDQVEAMTLADRIVVLNAGRIEQVGSPLELYEHPDNLFVAGFIGSPRMNFIPGRLTETTAQGATVQLGSGEVVHCDVDASAAKPGDEVTLGARPEHLRLEAGPNLMSVTVTFVESLGSSTQAYCAMPGVEEALTCTLGGQSRVRDGQRLALGIAPRDCYLFDAGGKAFARRRDAAMPTGATA